MEPEMIPCESCARHVRRGASACPFCSAPQPERTTRATAVVRLRGTRAAVLALGATVGLASCAASVGSADANHATDTREDTSFAPPYGVAPFDAGVEQ